ncbi:MAG TPA: TonB-dependent receptor [Cellvibrio sp.]|nr:TonB-dependent receptor [Cellvibrio sp.]
MSRFKTNPLSVVLFGIMASSATTLAQQSTQAPAQEIETIAVWGTQVKASSLAMDAETMEIKQPDHISDLLRVIPGVDVGGAHSLNQRITIRSMDDKDLRISIDGANQNTYMYHHMGNLQIHADILESAEIDVGNNSVVNGGLGGAVRFKTKNTKTLLNEGARFGGRLQGSYADNAGDSGAVTAYGQITDSIDALAYFNKVNRDNYEVGGGEILGADGLPVPGTDGTVRGLEGEVEDALVKLGWDINSDHRVKLGYESYTDEGDYSYRPDMGLATGTAIANSLKIPLTYPTEFSRGTTTFSYEGRFSETTKLDASIYRNESTFWRDETGLVTWNPALATINQGDANNTGFNLLFNTRSEGSVGHSFNYGLDRIQHKTDYIVDGDSLAGEESTGSALFIEDKITTDAGLNFIPGIRYESVEVESVVVTDTYSDINGAFAAEYEASENLLFRASVTELFRAPELSEVFIGAGLYDVPNPGIKAESGINQQLSFAYQDEILGATNFSLGATLFQTQIDNHIYDYANNPTGGTWKDNIGDMEIEGYEAYLGYDLSGLKTLLSYSVAESELAAFDQYRQFDKARIDRQQGDTLSFSLDYTFTSTDLSIHWDTLYVDDVPAGPDLDGATLENSKDGYAVSNISVHWESSFGLGLTAGVDNVFDEFYASQSSRTGTSRHPRFGKLYLMDYEPGRNAKVTLSYTF